ncbi:FAD-dependent oxidoreductase [Chloroflexota bacterium]
MYDLVIVGGGPAGLTAAVYAARKQINTLLVSLDIGGQVNTTLGVENYMGYQFVEGPELMNKFQEQVRQFPIEQKIGSRVIRVAQVKGGFQITSNKGEIFLTKTVIYAAGKTPRKLGVPGEADFTGRGVTYCAICDGPIFAGQRVAVVGGGNSALEATLDMAKIAEHVDLISLIDLTGDKVLVDIKNLTIYIGHETEEIIGDKMVSGIRMKNQKNGENISLPVGGIFIEIGLVPNTEVLKGLVKLNDREEVTIGYSAETDVVGFYAAGDVTNVLEKQIVVAAGEGAKAALQVHRYLQRLVD